MNSIDLINFFLKAWNNKTQSFDLEWYLEYTIEMLFNSDEDEFRGVHYKNGSDLFEDDEYDEVHEKLSNILKVEFAENIGKFDDMVVDHPSVVMTFKKRRRIINACNEKYITYRDILTSISNHSTEYTCSYYGQDEHNRTILKFSRFM